jgi:MCP family monocarboxylic acid transporter-like MFS transporter 10
MGMVDVCCLSRRTSFANSCWCVSVLGGFLVLFTTFGMLNAFGIFEQYYLAVYLPTTSPSQVAWVGSFQLFLQFGCGLLVGKLFDEGYFHYIIAFGSALWLVSWFCISISTKYWSIFLSQGLGLGT